MKKGQMLIMTAVVIMISLGAVFMWAEGGITKEVTIGQTQSSIFDAFSLGQTINNYLTDSAEIAKCNAMILTSTAAADKSLKIDEEKVTTQEYFEQTFIHSFFVYMADFPKIRKTSLQEDFSLYNNLFFELDFSYPEIKGAPARVISGGEPFTDYLEIVSENGFIYIIRPVFTIEMDNAFFEDLTVPEECTIFAGTTIEEATGTCSDSQYTDQTTCEAAGSCSDETSTTEDNCVTDGEDWTKNTWD